MSKKLITQKPNNPIIHGQLKHEEIFNILSYKGNASNIDIPKKKKKEADSVCSFFLLY
jgi:hypothetical protein